MLSAIITLAFMVVIIACIGYGIYFIFETGKWLAVILIIIAIAYMTIVVKNIIKK